MFAEKFGNILQEKQLTAYKVAKDLGISQGLMGEYKRGEKIPTVVNLIKIADYLDVSVDYLIGRETNASASVPVKETSKDFDNLHNEISKLTPKKRKQAEQFVEFLKTQEDLSQELSAGLDSFGMVPLPE